MGKMLLLNESGDLTLEWDERNDQEVAAIIEKKMKEGIRFFIVAPFSGEQTEIKALGDVKGRSVRVLDEDLEKLFTEGKAKVFKRTKATVDVQRSTDDPQEAAKSNTVAVRPMKGG